jgi:hypothetical protein
MSDPTTVLIHFRNQLVSFCDELIRQFPQEGDFVVFKLFITSQVPIKTIMEGFNRYINKNEQKIRLMIKARNDDFFIRENLFKFLSAERKNRLSTLWTDGRMDVEDKKVIWKWVDSFVMLGDRYAKITVV